MRFFLPCTHRARNRAPVAYHAPKRSETIARSGRRRARRYAMAGILMGVETEYAVVGTSVRGGRIEPDVLTERLMDQAVACLPHLPARSEPGIFLPNGGGLYPPPGAPPPVRTA